MPVNSCAGKQTRRLGRNTDLYNVVVFIWEERGAVMIDFEEELKKFQPSLEVEEAEESIYNHGLTDMTDILVEMMKERNSSSH